MVVGPATIPQRPVPLPVRLLREHPPRSNRTSPSLEAPSRSGHSLPVSPDNLAHPESLQRFGQLIRPDRSTESGLPYPMPRLRLRRAGLLRNPPAETAIQS